MSHTAKVLAAGIALLGVCLLAGRWLAGSRAGLTQGAKVFLLLWLIASAINLWFGVARAGYSVREEAPIFLLVFSIPAALALVAWWLSSQA